MAIKTVKSVSKKEGVSGDKPWTNYTVDFTDGSKASTFDGAAASLKAGDTKDFYIAKNDKGFWELNEWKDADPNSPPPMDSPPVAKADVPQGVWEAKDRAIAMEASFHYAAIFYAGKDKTDKELNDLAMAIYRRVEAARAGAQIG